MKTLNSCVPVLLVLVLLYGCGGGGGSPATSNGPTPPPTPSASNVLAITVNGTKCLNNASTNMPCASVTVCSPGTSNCQTIDGILLDTGSYGLRVFKQALGGVQPTQVTDASGSVSIAECVQFGDGSSMWGPVQMAGVILGGEPAVQVPIQVIDSTFGIRPAACSNAAVSPQDTNVKFNGILGVGVFASDCGSGCANSSANGLYYGCNGTTCPGAAVPDVNQVRNPVDRLPTDNNGVIIQLPAVLPNGALFLNGTMVLGVGTQSNNILSGVAAYATDQIGEFTTSFNGFTLTHSFIDSGSNLLVFNAPATLLTPCTGSNFYCPPTTTSLSATNSAASGSPSGAVSFQIGNFSSLAATHNLVFSDIGGSLFGSLSNGTFDWGLPFFMGRNVAVGISGKSSSLGTGPFWAY